MRNWLYTDKEFKRILARNNDPDNETESVVKTKAELLSHITNTTCYENLDHRILVSMSKATTFHIFNIALNTIYDYADENKIWLGFMPSKAEGK